MILWKEVHGRDALIWPPATCVSFSISVEVESLFVPWLMQEAERALDEKILARMLLDG